VERAETWSKVRIRHWRCRYFNYDKDLAVPSEKRDQAGVFTLSGKKKPEQVILLKDAAL
jgi:hypothetical protein